MGVTVNIEKGLRVFLVALGLGVLAGGALVLAGSQDRLVAAEVAVVLGNQVYADARPAPRLAARLDKSLELYRGGYLKTIIVSGGVGKSRVDEAGAMAAYLKARGCRNRP